jgi:hypothetical protein
MMTWISFWSWMAAAQPILIKCWLAEQERERAC